MSKRIHFILLMIVLAPGIEAREPDLSLSNSQFDGQVHVKQQESAQTWFGIGYESRREHTERANFEDNAMRESVFSNRERSFSSPERSGGMSRGMGGKPGGGSADRNSGGRR